MDSNYKYPLPDSTFIKKLTGVTENAQEKKPANEFIGNRAERRKQEALQRKV